ncbi:hypothetical protein LINGRAHAP2_LOCUS10222, partial [Linum grandiflorum]
LPAQPDPFLFLFVLSLVANPLSIIPLLLISLASDPLTCPFFPVFSIIDVGRDKIIYPKSFALMLEPILILSLPTIFSVPRPASHLFIPFHQRCFCISCHRRRCRQNYISASLSPSHKNLPTNPKSRNNPNVCLACHRRIFPGRHFPQPVLRFFCWKPTT